MKRLHFFILAGALLFLAAAVVTAQNSPVGSESADKTTQRAIYNVENMTCGACLTKINAVLGPLEGFSGMGGNLLRNKVAVDFVAPMTPEKIGSTITNLGYPATLDTVDAIGEKETFASMQSQRKTGGYGGGCCGGGSAPAVTATCPGGGQTGSGCGLPPAAQKAEDI